MLKIISTFLDKAFLDDSRLTIFIELFNVDDGFSSRAVVTEEAKGPVIQPKEGSHMGSHRESTKQLRKRKFSRTPEKF